MYAGGGVGGQAMLKFENNAGTLDHKDAAFEKPVLLSVIIKVRLCGARASLRASSVCI